MLVPSMCRKSTSFDRTDAGWYVHDSVYYRDIVPDWRLAGGGVTKDSLSQDLVSSFDKAILYSKQSIAEIESHIKKLERAKAEITQK